MTDAPVAHDSRSRQAVTGVVLLAFILRVAQLSSAMLSPLTYQPGPDEDYYHRLGEAVAAGQGAQLGPEFTFMDPAYGYILGLIFKLVGANLFVVYLLQVFLDTATAFGIVTIGRLLGRPKAGVIGGVIYALTATAVMFCTTLLKEVWVTAWLTWWGGRGAVAHSLRTSLDVARVWSLLRVGSRFALDSARAGAIGRFAAVVEELACRAGPARGPCSVRCRDRTRTVVAAELRRVR